MKTALITGGNKGIGLETTRYFLTHGYKVIVIARDFSDFEFASNNHVTPVEFDISDIDRIPALVSELGRVDVLVNNAGIMLSLPYDDYPQNRIDLILKVNIEAPIALITAVSKGMIAQESGRIVNNASIAGQIGHPDVWYGITKAGLLNATKSFSKILGPHGIQVNAVAASPVETDMLNVIPEARRNDFKKTVVTGRFATAEEIAKTMGWLGIEAPEYINGICIDINNGSYLR
jgi:3-oxoacyl-[acyl-carrier protein] reductase